MMNGVVQCGICLEQFNIIEDEESAPFNINCLECKGLYWSCKICLEKWDRCIYCPRGPEKENFMITEEAQPLLITTIPSKEEVDNFLKRTSSSVAFQRGTPNRGLTLEELQGMVRRQCDKRLPKIPSATYYCGLCFTHKTFCDTKSCLIHLKDVHSMLCC